MRDPISKIRCKVIEDDTSINSWLLHELTPVLCTLMSVHTKEKALKIVFHILSGFCLILYFERLSHVTQTDLKLAILPQHSKH